MEKIKIKMIDWYPGYNPEDDEIMRILKKRYDVEYSDDPDFVICGVYGEVLGKEALKSEAVRVFWTGEAVSPNFNFYDYAVGFDDISFGDRYMRMPLCCVVYDDRRKMLIESREKFDLDELRRKDLFANFVYSNQYGQSERKTFFQKLCEYKQVASAGGYLNNMDGYRCKDKISFQARSKFTIAFENGCYSGYSTEKIIDAFAAHTIPIYWGNPDINLDFDEKAFINCHKYDSFEDVIEKVREIDEDDELYIDMIRHNPFVYSFDEKKIEYEKFLYSIFDRDRKTAYRRNRSLFGTRLEKNEIRKIQCYPLSHLYSNRITEKIFRNLNS